MKGKTEECSYEANYFGVVFFTEVRGADDKGFIMIEKWYTSFHVTAPALRSQSISIPVGEDSLEPTLQDCGEVQPEHWCDKR